MSRCTEARHVQDYLDHELSPESARVFEAHLAGCPICGAEIEAFSAVFTSLGSRVLQVADPGPSLTERILDRVLPTRLRARWVTAFGWAYGSASAVTTFAFVSWIVQPSTHVWLAQSYAEGSVRLMQTLLFTFQSLTRSWLQVVDGLVFLGAVIERMAPVARALTRPWAEPQLAALMVAAILASGALLWWMRPVRREAMEDIGNVGLLGF